MTKDVVIVSACVLWETDALGDRRCYCLGSGNWILLGMGAIRLCFGHVHSGKCILLAG